MSFLVGSIKLQVYNDSAQTEFPKINLPAIEQDFSKTTVTAVQAVSIPVVAAATYTLTPTDHCSGLYIYSDNSAIDLSIDGGAALTIAAGIPGFLPVTVITSVGLHNTTLVDTNVTLILVQG